jgi:hypothetical protein
MAAIAIVLLTTVAAVPLFDAGLQPALAWQDAAPIEIGAGPTREQAFSLVGRAVYAEDSVQVFGYLTDVIGLDPALLFADAVPSPQTARFTYASAIPLASRGTRGDVTVYSGEGTVSIFYDEEAGAAWDDPGSFADGEPVAELSLTLRDTLQRQAPVGGGGVGNGRYRQDAAGEFVIGGETYRFGQSGIEGRLRTVGALVEGDGLVVGLTGSGSVSAREAVPVIAGASGA